jgi:hypothetical protein
MTPCWPGLAEIVGRPGRPDGGCGQRAVRRVRGNRTGDTGARLTDLAGPRRRFLGGPGPSKAMAGTSDRWHQHARPERRSAGPAGTPVPCRPPAHLTRRSGTDQCIAARFASRAVLSVIAETREKSNHLRVMCTTDERGQLAGDGPREETRSGKRPERPVGCF